MTTTKGKRTRRATGESNLAQFQRYIVSAQRLGVLPAFIKRYRSLRRTGVDPMLAAASALRDATALADTQPNPRANLGVTVSTKMGES